MASFQKVNAILFAIDSAAVSGVVLSNPDEDGRGRVRDYEDVLTGEARTQKHRVQYVEEAVELASDMQKPLVIIGEEWTPHGISTAAYASLCESWGMWLAAFEVCGVSDIKNGSHIVRVNPNTWRNAVFGKNRPKTRDALKAHAIRYVHLTLDQPANLSDNIAEAMCIRVWAQHVSEIHSLLKPAKKKAAAKKR